MQLLGVFRPLRSKPAGQFSFGVLIDEIKRRLLVPSDPVDVRAMSNETLRGSQLASAAGAPKRLSDLLAIRTRSLSEDHLDPIEQPERGGVAQSGGCASFHEPPGGRPVSEAGSIRERSSAAEDCAGCLDIGSCIEQCIEDGDVVAAGGPVQRRLGVMAELAVGIDIATGRYQTSDNRRPVGKVPWPICRRMQQRPIAIGIADAGRREPRVGGEDALERSKIARLYGFGGRHCARIISRHEAYGAVVA